MDSQLIGEIKDRLGEAKKIVIASHVRPDGDAIGSLLGLGLALRDAGKSVQMVLADGVPSSFKYLEGSKFIEKEPKGNHDTFITVDCADFKRTGSIFENFGQPDINIDHHKTNEKFGKLNLIEAEEVATSAILTNYLPAWGLTITKPIAAALLTGIITDTLGFRTSNITPEALRQAATAHGNRRGYARNLHALAGEKDHSLPRAIGARDFPPCKARMALCGVRSPLQTAKLAGYGGNDDADLINMISAIDGNKVGMVFVEQNNNHVKISWRALEAGVDVSQVAKHFQGGGHAAAAGADIEGSLSEVQKEVLKKTREMLNL